MGVTKIPVLYIGGWGRSGSTLIANILGSLDPFIHVGELSWIWEHGWKLNYLCGCGNRFSSCEFWRNVVFEFEKDVGNIDVDKMIYIRNKMAKKKLLYITEGKINDEMIEYLNCLRILYEKIYANSGNKIIIDSSKAPSHFFALKKINDVELYLLHLVRDARGCAYSWKKIIYRNDAEPGKEQLFQRLTPASSTIKWCMRNIFFEMYKSKKYKYTLLKYESFVKDVSKHVSMLTSKYAGMDNRIENIEVGVNHTIWGNPSRLKRGKIEIRTDDAWRREMQWKDRLLVTALSWPLLLKYGYLGKTS